MNLLGKCFSMLALGLTTMSCFAAPTYLITNNLTEDESNAYIAGTIASQYPTKAQSQGKVSWLLVQMACYGHTEKDICSALIKMKTNTPRPVELGTVYLNLKTGDINPKRIEHNGYTMFVPEGTLGEATITKSPN